VRQALASLGSTRAVEAARAFIASGLRVFSPAKRLSATAAIDFAFIPTATYLAFWLRFDGDIPPEYIGTYLQTLPLLLTIRGLLFVPFGLFGGLWKYTGIWDLSRIVLSVVTSSALLYVLEYQELGPGAYPRSVVIIDALLLVWLLGGVRLLWRVFPALLRRNQGRRVLIVGAGDAGDMIVREMHKSVGYRPVGFVDDDPSKLGRTIHGIKVLGSRADLPRVVQTTRPSEVLVAIPSATPADIRACVQLLEGFKLPITTLPSLKELVNGKVGVKEIRPLAIEDLLPRSQVTLNNEDGRRLIKGKRVLVTGAGGSIGSELCRQIASLEPTDLILYERYENSLYAIANDLHDRGVKASVHPMIGDVTDAARLTAAFAQHRPHIVFHAAAHKHVPLMEANPCEAIKNNVVGTQLVAETSRDYGVERFVFVSTDKAANPSSVMGASKRVAELIVQAVGAGGGPTRFVTVRFGNVLGSNGSVIPRILDQIRAGGPVTVTHPEIRRYFMLIPEAVQLVLQAAVLSHERETFVLDMGEQIKVLDVARNLIRLSGFVPDEEIPIKFIGLRPGEKLLEELVGNGELLQPAGIEKIFRVQRTETLDLERLAENTDKLVQMAEAGNSNAVLRCLRQIVPSFSAKVPPEPDIPVPLDAPVRRKKVPAGATLPAAVPTTPDVVPAGVSSVTLQAVDRVFRNLSEDEGAVPALPSRAASGARAKFVDTSAAGRSAVTARRRTLPERMLLMIGWTQRQQSARD
jgi:FlaA1/EpsC-like NDP-sugar epimerase